MPLEDAQPQMFWVNGPAGVGKIAITQTLCELLRRLGVGFFSRSVSGCRSPLSLFPTLAYQLSNTYPNSFGREIDKLIQDFSAEINPRPSTDEATYQKYDMELQFEKLIFNPLKRVRNVPVPVILIIDGLDEASAATTKPH
ncbi:hypothetical protein BDN70DRAFT_937029 [Pholiota conissans]|uniref:Nephrocystin 3-like N-terminal domain-containing protein n=1 Tax=Pholiota conissans TaxID=109636 RepID=A0A9P5YSJ7_9AGAR|nr:hypothetical protein BDN70DRAFT_937029 [Pholiota conissans]